MAFVSSGRGTLAPLALAPKLEQFNVSYDFSPVVERIEGRLLTTSNPHMPEREVEIGVWPNFNDYWRKELLPGFQFKLFESRWAKVKDSQPIGLGRIQRGLLGCRYEADAEVQVKFLKGLNSGAELSGELFNFGFEQLGKRYYGHLDSRDFSKDLDRERKTGNAFLCLHNLTLSSTSPNPGGRPLYDDLKFVILRKGDAVGQGVVTRVLPTYPIISICRPNIFV